MNKLQELKAELATAKEELSNCGRSKPQFLIDDDDEYQDQLELGWHKDEIRDRIESNNKRNDSNYDENDFMLNPKEVLIQGDNDRAIFAPPLEDDPTFEQWYAKSKTIREMLKIAKQRGYDVDIDNEYNGVMY